MSHAANLRNRQRSSPVSSSKRRRVASPGSARPQPSAINGLLNGHVSHKFSAVPVKDVKAPLKTQTSASEVTIGHGNEDVDMDQAAKWIMDASSDDSDSEDDGAASPSQPNASEAEEPRKEDEDEAEDDNNEEDEKSEEDSRPEQREVEQRQPTTKLANGASAGDQGQAEPSFGDLLRARGEEPLTIPASLPADPESKQSSDLQGRASSQRTALRVPTANSLGSVLTQALRTNDVPLLESCLQVSSLPSIRATIERLPSAHASDLLQRLAERMHKRPGRAGSLMVWIQWTVVAHGGYLACQPAAMRSLQALYRVVKQRASGLQPLLALKGKLDMLEAQLQLRRNRMAASSDTHTGIKGRQGVIYVEGEESSSGEDEEDAERDRSANYMGLQRKRKRKDAAMDEGLGESDEAAMIPDGVDASEAEDEDAFIDQEQSSSDEDEDDLIHDQAESTDNDSDAGLSEDIDYDDINDDEDDGADEAEAVADSVEREDTQGEPASTRRRRTLHGL